jgi:hypothetical protein
MGRLIKDIPLTFYRFGEQEIDDNGNLVNTEATMISTKGSLQPLQKGDITLLQEGGLAVDGSRIYYTKTKLKGADPYGQTQPDEVEIDGVVHEVFDPEDWNQTKVLRRVAHYKYILARRRQGEEEED